MLCLPSRSTRSYQRRVSEGAHGEDRYVFSMSAGRLTKEPWRVARRRGAPRRAPGMLACVVRSPEPATRLGRCRFARFVAARPRRAVIALTCRELRVDRVTAECRRPRHATDSFQADSTSLTDTRSRTPGVVSGGDERRGVERGYNRFEASVIPRAGSARGPANRRGRTPCVRARSQAVSPRTAGTTSSAGSTARGRGPQRRSSSPRRGSRRRHADSDSGSDPSSPSCESRYRAVRTTSTRLACVKVLLRS